MPSRIYLDNAATSWPKPPAVYDAMDRWQRENGAAAGRGTSAESMETDRLIADARRGVAQLLGVDDPRRIVFTLNGTDALHLAIQGLVRPGDHVLTTAAEHNSVLRPLQQLEDRRGVAVTHVGCDASGRYDAAAVLAAVNSRTTFVVATHASNVTGVVQPAADVGAELRKRGIPFVVDAAQTVGEWPFVIGDLPCDLLAAPGHKGLLGPLGTGLLYVRPGLEERLMCIRSGGTGSESHSLQQPSTLPERYESGNLNVPGIVGLGAAARWLAERGVVAVREHARSLTEALLAGFSTMPGVRIIGPPDAASRLGVVSLTIDGYDPQEAAAVLATSFGVQTRAGLHCAPLVHKALGTFERGGTIRFSVGPFNTPDDVAAAVDAVRQMQ
jgi:cysteine desulfurase/selenocysteine lyase